MMNVYVLLDQEFDHCLIMNRYHISANITYTVFCTILVPYHNKNLQISLKLLPCRISLKGNKEIFLVLILIAERTQKLLKFIRRKNIYQTVMIYSRTLLKAFIIFRTFTAVFLPIMCCR